MHKRGVKAGLEELMHHARQEQGEDAAAVVLHVKANRRIGKNKAVEAIGVQVEQACHFELAHAGEIGRHFFRDFLEVHVLCLSIVGC